jgi:hypothetical protein
MEDGVRERRQDIGVLGGFDKKVMDVLLNVLIR